MGISLQFIVVVFALAATFSLTFATHYHDGKLIKELEIEGVVYCSSDGNKKSSRSRILPGAKVSLSCDGGVTTPYETRSEHDGEFEIEIEDQAKVDSILNDISKCVVFVHLPVKGCPLAPSNGFLKAHLDSNVEYDGDEAEVKALPFKFVSCLG